MWPESCRRTPANFANERETQRSSSKESRFSPNTPFRLKLQKADIISRAIILFRIGPRLQETDVD